MKRVCCALSVGVLGAAFVVVPVVSVGASPHAVRPTVERVHMPAASVARATTASGIDASAPDAADAGTNTAPATGAESVLTRDTDGTDVVGVGFPDLASAQGVTVSVRSRDHGRWGTWTEVGLSDSAPDPGTAEAAQAKVATEPVGVAGSEQVQIRVSARKATARLDRLEATFVDGGTSAADASLASTPAATASAAATKPALITRAQWGADESLRNCGPDYVDKVKGAIVHHTVNTNTYSADQAAGLVRGIYAYHVNGNGWCDIGYQFLVDRFGRLYEGRFGGDYKNVVGAQAQGFNMQSFGISSIANHDPGTSGAAAPSSAVLSAIGKLIGWKAWLNGWDPSTSVSYTSAGSSRWDEGTVITKPRVSGHRDFNLTTCPGDLMFSKLSSIRSTATASYRAGLADVAAVATNVVETYGKPAGTSISLAGRGYGHGRGMSQYGAYGAALSGLTNAQITSFYYPGTTRVTTAGNPSIRVRLSEIGSGGTQVVYASGLAATDGTRTVSLSKKTATGAQVTRWRVVPSGSGLSLQWNDGGWKTLSGWSALAVPITFQNATAHSVRLVLFGNGKRDYRGSVRTHRVGSGASSVNVVPLQSYLQGVVPAEMPPSWSPEALQAQAVAARTYVLRLKASAASGQIYDTCDTTACQVYRGGAEWTSTGSAVQREWPTSTAAVAATSGVALTSGGSWILAEFSASNGGQTVASSLAYQKSFPDPYDGIPSGSPSTWSKTISLTTIQNAYPGIGTFRGLQVNARNGISWWGGRSTSVTVLGSSGSTKVTGDQFRSTMGLRSTWWTVSTAPATSRATFPKDVSSDTLGDLLAVDAAGSLHVLRGNGAGGFSPVTTGAGWGDYDLVTSAGSWTSDNRHDVLARRGGTLYVYPGDANGRLLPRYKLSTEFADVNLLLGMGDLSGDKHPDLVSRRTDGTLWLHRSDGAGRIVSTVALGTGWSSMRSLVAPGDITGDGIPDLVSVRSSDNTMYVYPGNASGVLTSRRAIAGSWAGYSAFMGAGDVTGDGRNDLVARRTSDGALVVFAGNSMASFSLHSVVSGTATWSAWTRWSP